MEIISQRQVRQRRESGKSDTKTLEGCIFEINRKLGKAKSESTFVGIQVTLPEGEFGALLAQLHLAGYHPTWEKKNWKDEGGNSIYNLRVPLDGEELPVTCDNCGEELSPLHFLGGDGVQFDDVLAIGFFGGYGMYIEEGTSPTKIPGATAEALLCKSCADQLLQAFPSLGRIVSSAPQF